MPKGKGYRLLQFCSLAVTERLAGTLVVDKSSLVVYRANHVVGRLLERLDFWKLEECLPVVLEMRIVLEDSCTTG